MLYEVMRKDWIGIWSAWNPALILHMSFMVLTQRSDKNWGKSVNKNRWQTQYSLMCMFKHAYKNTSLG